jgi:DNA-binding transcriptional ArsR family regulator
MMQKQAPICTSELPALDDSQISTLAHLFHLLGDEGRIRLVLACMHGPVAVSELAQTTGMSQSLTSHHLRHLREARILRSQRQGKQILYQLDDHHIRHVVQDLACHVTEHK